MISFQSCLLTAFLDSRSLSIKQFESRPFSRIRVRMSLQNIQSCKYAIDDIFVDVTCHQKSDVFVQSETSSLFENNVFVTSLSAGAPFSILFANSWKPLLSRRFPRRAIFDIRRSSSRSISKTIAANVSTDLSFLSGLLREWSRSAKTGQTWRPSKRTPNLRPKNPHPFECRPPWKSIRRNPSKYFLTFVFRKYNERVPNQETILPSKKRVFSNRLMPSRKQQSLMHFSLPKANVASQEITRYTLEHDVWGFFWAVVECVLGFESRICVATSRGHAWNGTRSAIVSG